MRGRCDYRVWDNGQGVLDSDRPLEVVMLEARDGVHSAERRIYYTMFEGAKEKSDCRVKRVAGIRRRDRQGCSMQTGCAVSSRRRAGRCIHISSLQASYRGCSSSRRTLRSGCTRSHTHSDIRAKHVVHTTNGWSSHFLAPMWERIILMRGHMTAQCTGTDDGQLGTYTQARPRIDGTTSLSSTLTLRHSVRNYQVSAYIGEVLCTGICC